MRVIATAGHVDHGKSTLVRTLTGQDPDRLAEEHRRGLSIELGYCWTTLAGVGDVAFVDVPGHERFVSTMLAGVGPVPAVLFVVAADDPWMPQASEHLAALDAFGVRRGVVAITRSDLADPSTMVAESTARLQGTSLEGADVIPLSARTGHGLDALRDALASLAGMLPAPARDDPVRLWVDRRFHISGAGTVVTGTLPAGRVRVGDLLAAGAATVRVRGMESLGRPADEVEGVARVAVSLGGGVTEELRRGSVLVTPGRWRPCHVVDVRVSGSVPLTDQPVLHIGAAAAATRFRPLGGDVGRLSLERPLPLRVGDRVVLRDPGTRGLWGATVLDPAPPTLGRRGDARRRAALLAPTTGLPDLADELRRRRVVRISELRLMGVPVDAARVKALAVAAGDWLLDRRRLAPLQDDLVALVEERGRTAPLDPGVALTVAARALGLPTADLVPALVASLGTSPDGAPGVALGAEVGPALRVVDGRVVHRDAQLPLVVLDALRQLGQDLAEAPFAAPDADRLIELGLDQASLAAAERQGRVLRLSDGIVLLPGADLAAATALADLSQPFTTSQARVRLGTTRRVAIPLLALLDARRLTRRLPDDRREVVPRPST